MILILSSAQAETTTELVMDWLESLGVSFFRLNMEDLTNPNPDITWRFSEESLTFQHRDAQFSWSSSQFTAAWLRQWKPKVESSCLFAENPDRMLKSETTLHDQLKGEISQISGALLRNLSEVHWLLHPDSAQINKLHCLQRAKGHGFRVPASLVTNSRSALEDFATHFAALISKPMSNGVALTEGTRYFIPYTTEIDTRRIRDFPEVFPLTYFQEKISKSYEIRTFYLDRKTYSMAIFSQEDPRTTIDFRRYNFDKPNRMVPYQIPVKVESRLLDLMLDLNLDCGSIDFIQTPDEGIVFLEINAGGQFLMVSHPCNYALEKRVAEALTRRARS